MKARALALNRKSAKDERTAEISLEALPGGKFLYIMQTTAMEPTFKIGDVLYIDPAATHTDGIYCIEKMRAGKKEIEICRVQSMGNGKLRLFYDNPSFPQELVEADGSSGVHAIGRVIRGLHRVDGWEAEPGHLPDL